MSPLKTLTAAAVVLAVAPLAACSQEAQAPAAADKQQIEQIVRDYLMNNPEVILQAIDAMQKRNEQASMERQRQAVDAIAADLKDNPADPVIGNPDGDVTVVEFFDYRCGFCKRVFPDVQALLKEDGNVRYVLKEFPILGPDSVYASRAAQAVWLHQPDKYAAFHIAMMENRGDLGQDKVMELAGGAGVDVVKLPEQMQDPQVQQTLDANMKQAQVLGISGTPAFIFGANIQPGAIPLTAMRDLVAAMRAHP